MTKQLKSLTGPVRWLFLMTMALLCGTAWATDNSFAGGLPLAAAGGDHGHASVLGEATLLSKLGYSYLTAYMFCLSICVGSLFLVIVHHLFDAAWSVPVRRVAEQVACLMWGPMVALLLPIILLQKSIYPWLSPENQDHSWEVKKILYNPTMFSIVPLLLVASWGFIAKTFRGWSLAQDKDGAAKWTGYARKLAAGGIFYFAFSLTLVCFYLMKSLQHQFFSTMYGVYYFAGSVWVTLVTLFVLSVVLRDRGPLRHVVSKRQIQDLGVLFFAFTVFYAYIHFSQYFLIWNAALPEETFWYVVRESGSWQGVGFLILFGHFFVPFLILLNQDIKTKPMIMFPMAAWAWLMHYVDMTFNIMPVLYPEGLHFTLLDPLLWLGMAGLLGVLFWRNYHASAPYPLRDPRLKEAVVHHEVPTAGQHASQH